VEAVLRWSWWRRWHQAWARYYHYRRHTEQSPARSFPRQEEVAAAGEQGAGVPADLVEKVWQRLKPLLPQGKRSGRPYGCDRRVIVEAIVHQMQTGCAWNTLPSLFPAYQTVHSQLRNWQKTGIWAKVWEGLEQPRPS
jgi:hypothetical protein